MRKSTLLFAGLLLALFALVATPKPAQVAGFEAEARPCASSVCILWPMQFGGSGASGNPNATCNTIVLGCSTCCDQNHCGDPQYNVVAGNPACSCSQAWMHSGPSC